MHARDYAWEGQAEGNTFRTLPIARLPELPGFSSKLRVDRFANLEHKAMSPGAVPRRPWWSIVL